MIGARIEVPRPFITENQATSVVLHHPDDRTQSYTFPPLDQYTRMVEHFADAVLNGTALRYTPGEARAQMRVLDALSESAKTGKAIRI